MKILLEAGYWSHEGIPVKMLLEAGHWSHEGIPEELADYSPWLRAGVGVIQRRIRHRSPLPHGSGRALESWMSQYVSDNWNAWLQESHGALGAIIGRQNMTN